MNCKICYKNDPKHYFRYFGSGKEPVDVFVCEECLKKITGGSEPLGMIEEEICVKGEVSSESRSLDYEAVKAKTKCNNCSTDLNDIEKTGKFGCEDCYHTFSDLIAIADSTIANKTDKLKEVVGDKTEDNPISNELQALKNKMEKAIKKENYEEAAKLRDQISKIEKGE